MPTRACKYALNKECGRDDPPTDRDCSNCVGHNFVDAKKMIDVKDPEPYKMTFGRKLRMLRVDRGFTQEEMAAKLGITRRAYIPYEHDEAKPRNKDTYEKMADILNCKVEALTDLITKLPETTDNVSHPVHYVEGRKYEPKDVIRDWALNYNLGCVVKYVSRAGRKDDILQDLKKARQYLDFEIEALEAE